MSRLSAADSLGHGWNKALHPDDRETVIEGWKTYARLGRSWEYRLLTPEGKIRWIRALGGPIYSTGDEITGYIGTVEDITEQKDGQRVLQESEALNRAVLNSLPANIAVLDNNGMIQAVNEEWRRFAEATGHPPDCSVGIGANYLEVCRRAAGDGSGDAERAFAGIQDVLAGKLQSFTMQYPCESATENRWFQMLVTHLAGVTSSGAVITHADITERKWAEDAMRGQRERLAEARGMERFRLSFEEAPVGMALIGADGEWLRVNRALCEMTGYTENELISHWRDITYVDDRAEQSLLLFRIVSGELAAGRLEARYMHKLGHTICVLVNIAVVERDKAGRPVHFVAHVQDLTERKRVEQELEATVHRWCPVRGCRLWV
jgi:PAS domain S-box-containing protein